MNTVRLTPQSERLLEQQLRRSSFGSPEDVIERALETLAETEPISPHGVSSIKSAADAVGEILEIQKRNRLDGLKIKDLIHNGNKY
jgi:hypothetical protein